MTKMADSHTSKKVSINTQGSKELPGPHGAFFVISYLPSGRPVTFWKAVYLKWKSISFLFEQTPFQKGLKHFLSGLPPFKSESVPLKFI